MEPYESYIPPTKPKPLFPTEAKELFFALGCLISGLLLVNCIYAGGFQLGFAIAAILNIVLGTGYLLSRRCTLTGYNLTIFEDNYPVLKITN